MRASSRSGGHVARSNAPKSGPASSTSTLSDDASTSSPASADATGAATGDDRRLREPGAPSSQCRGRAVGVPDHRVPAIINRGFWRDSMHAAVIREFGATPTVEEWPEPVPTTTQTLVETGAAALNPVDLTIASRSVLRGRPGAADRGRARGRRRVISSPSFAAGTRVYTLKAVTGSLAGRFVVDPAETWELPAGDDDAAATALGIAGLAGWLAVEERAGSGRRERAGAGRHRDSGQHRGAGRHSCSGPSRVVAAGRDAARLEREPRARRRRHVCTWARPPICNRRSATPSPTAARTCHRPAVGRARTRGDDRRARRTRGS